MVWPLTALLPEWTGCLLSETSASASGSALGFQYLILKVGVVFLALLVCLSS